MKTTYILKSGTQITFEDATSTYTLISGATLLSVQKTLTPNLVNVRKLITNNAPLNATATSNVDYDFKSISAIASLIQGASTNGKTWLNRNMVNNNQTTINTNQSNSTQQTTATNTQTNTTISLKEAEKLAEDICAFCEDFDFEPDVRTLNHLCFDKRPTDFLINQMILMGYDDDIVKHARSEFKSQEWKTILERIKHVKPLIEINQRLHIYCGKKGTGKSTLARKKYPNAVKINGKPNFDLDNLFFTFNAKTLKKDIPTEITLAMINGLPIIIDEGHLYPAGFWESLQSVLDSSDEITVYGNNIKIKAGFKIILTMNLIDKKAGKFTLPEAIISRAAEIENFDNISYETMARFAWGF